jgi:hypothetical protein
LNAAEEIFPPYTYGADPSSAREFQMAEWVEEQKQKARHE